MKSDDVISQFRFLFQMHGVWDRQIYAHEPQNRQFAKPKTSSLSAACQKGQLDVIQSLVEGDGVDVNEKDEDGWTPLITACVWNRADVVHYLVSRCNVDAHCNLGNTALTWTCLRNRDMDIVRCLVEEGRAFVNVKNMIGQTPLMIACVKGRLDIVRYLVSECGAEVDAKNNEGETALTRACWYTKPDVVRYMVERAHADVSTRNNKGEMPLHLTTSIEIFNYLLANTCPWARVPEQWKGA